MVNYLSFILIGLVGLSKAIQDIIQFHFDLSIFSLFKNQNYFNPNLSWKNKYNISKNKIISYLFQTVFVFITDFWHLIGFFRTLFIVLAIVF